MDQVTLGLEPNIIIIGGKLWDIIEGTEHETFFFEHGILECN